MSELGVADLQNARQSKTFFVHVLRIGGRARLTRNDFHPVGGLDGIERRNIPEVEKPTPPRPVIGIGPVQNGKVHWIGAVFDEIEPVVIVNASTLQRALPVRIRQRSVSWKRRRIITVWPKI